MSVASRSLAKWSLPLLVSLLAACGGGSGGGSDNRGNGPSAGPAPGTGPADSTTPAPAPAPTPPNKPGEALNARTCELHYRAAAPALPLTGTDPLLSTQWHLNNTGSESGSVAGEDLKLLGAWAAGKGEGIRVAVIDDALDVTHPDLLPNIVPGGSYNYLSYKRGSAYPLPCARSDTHGTEVGGVIASRDNNRLGGSGVAPRARLVGFNAIASGLDQDVLNALTRDNDRNHIYNNSWGADDDGHFHPPPSSLRSTIADGLKHGRNGLGSIYVFAAGNGGCLQGDSPQTCQGTELSSYDGHVSLLGTLAVCATNARGVRAAYSEPGANLLVCAPSGDLENDLPRVVTTDVKDGYSKEFNGTSAATPMISGVTALMLQANPNLSWRDVRQILARSARKVDPGSRSWTRFGELNFSHEYGFGVANADAAVRMARSWQSIGGSNTLKQCGPFSSNIRQLIPEVSGGVPAAPGTLPDYNLPATGGLSSSIAIPANCDIRHIEHVQVNLKTGAPGAGNHLAPHPDTGHLHITLTSPAGQTSTLLSPHPCYISTGQGSSETFECDGLNDFSIGLTRHMDEPATMPGKTAWLLRAVDRQPGDSGQLLSWSITLYGR